MFSRMILALSLSLLFAACQSAATEPTTDKSDSRSNHQGLNAGVELQTLDQDPNGPVQWSFGAKHLQGDDYEVVFQADILDGWFLYSQFLESEDGPVATSFTFESKNVVLDGPCAEEGDKIERYDELFQMNIAKYKHQVIFRQKIKATDKSQPISGYLTFMTCDDEKCLPPTDIDFNISLP